jgi:phage tail-like protein
MADYTSDPAVTVCFSVVVDGHDLGAFMTCDGLGVEVEIKSVEEGGNNGFIHQLGGRMKYTNVKLSRPINLDSPKVASWISGMNGTVKRTTAHIVAMTAEGKRVATWNLEGVVPIRWTGPQFSTDSPKVATETLELAHHGFL